MIHVLGKIFAKSTKNEPKTLFEASKSVKIKLGKSRLSPEMPWKVPVFDMFYVKTQPFLKKLTLARIRCFATFGRTGGGVGATPPPLGVSIRNIVELSGKDQQIALAEYSRLVVLFLVLGQYLTQLWQVKGQIFWNSMIFLLRVHNSKTIYRSGMGPSPSCSPFNSAHNELFWCISV